MTATTLRPKGRPVRLPAIHEHALDCLTTEWQTAQLCKRLAGCNPCIFDHLVADGLAEKISVPTSKWGEVFNTVYYRLLT
jgi:hypothetical protein